MTDVLDTLSAYPDDASIMMSKRVVADVVDEIARLRVERDVLCAELSAAEARAERAEADAAIMLDLLNEAHAHMYANGRWTGLRSRILCFLAQIEKEKGDD